MGAILVYIIKSGIALMLFYIFYRLLLPNHTFHRFNRLIVLGIVVLSVLIPLYTPVLKVEKEMAPIYTVALFNESVEKETALPDLQNYIQDATVPVTGHQNTKKMFWLFVGITYLAGCLFFFLYTQLSFYRLYKLIRRSDIITTEERSRLIITDEEIAPFSWMNYIIISRQDWQEYGENIVLHEQGHILAGHSWDLLLIQFFIIFHWYNPAAWLLKKELQNIHEYEADEYVLGKGVNSKQYQLLLIEKAVGTQRFTAMANNFNHSKLKKRITMMLKDKPNPWACLKYFYILPVSLLVINGFARPEIANEMKKISDITITQIHPREKDQLLQTEEKLANLEPVITSDLLNSPEESVQAESNRSVVLEQEEKVKIENESIVKIMEEPDNQIVQEVNENEKNKLTSETIQTYNFTNAKLTEKEFNVDLPESFQAWNAKKNKHFDTGFQLKKDSTNNPLLIIDGKEFPYSEMGKIDPQNIESISVLKDQSATAFYGQKGTNGVILINTKKSTGRIISRGHESELPDKKIRVIFNEVQENGLSKVFIDYKMKPQRENETAGTVWMGENMRLIINNEDVSNKEIETLLGEQIETLKIVNTETQQGTINTIYITTKE